MRKSSVLAALVVLTSCGLACAAESPTMVSAPAGRLEGTQQGNLRTFKGIPYAAAPVGELRWRPPQPVNWPGVRQATEFGPSCPQPMAADGTPNLGGVQGVTSEDCLTLNIWTPSKARRLPVLVWIHGGAGAVGGGSAYDGAAFARDGVVLVTFNYRLGAMGSFAHPAITREAPADEPLANYALMDQIAVLRWVRSNIAAFGGDPSQVTVGGQSSGGGAVLNLLSVTRREPLFARAIVQSGGGWFPPASLADHERLGSVMAGYAKLPGSKATLEHLRALRPEAMGPMGLLSADQRLVQESTTEAIEAGRTRAVPLLIGWNSFEASTQRRIGNPGQTVAAIPPDVRATYPAQLDDLTLLREVLGDQRQGAPTRWVAAKVSSRAPAFLYHFSYVARAERNRSPGAAHASELPFVFDDPRLGGEDRVMAARLHGCWVSFVKFGRPSCAGVESWPRYSNAVDRLVEFGSSTTVRNGFRRPMLDAHQARMKEIVAARRQEVERVIAQGH